MVISPSKNLVIYFSSKIRVFWARFEIFYDQFLLCFLPLSALDSVPVKFKIINNFKGIPARGRLFLLVKIISFLRLLKRFIDKEIETQYLTENLIST